MSKDNLCIQEFLPSQVLERHTGLDQKRRKYLELMNDKTAPWANVHGLDQRHDDFEDFRFLYYKFFISCQVLLISKKWQGMHARGTSQTNGYSFNLRDLFTELSRSFCNKIDEEIFQQAGDVIHRYTTGEVSF